MQNEVEFLVFCGKEASSLDSCKHRTFPKENPDFRMKSDPRVSNNYTLKDYTCDKKTLDEVCTWSRDVALG